MAEETFESGRILYAHMHYFRRPGHKFLFKKMFVVLTKMNAMQLLLYIHMPFYLLQTNTQFIFPLNCSS